MKRTTFLGSSAAALVTAAPSSARALVNVPTFSFSNGLISQAEILASFPEPVAGTWVRLVLGTGVQYQKQIGAGSEPNDGGTLTYFETQNGVPGGSCNPNTTKRTYVKAWVRGSLLVRQPVLAEVSDTGNSLYRYADVAGGQPQSKIEANLLLLDLNYLYDDRPLRIVSRKRELLTLPGAAIYEGGDGSPRGVASLRETTHIVAEFVGPTTARRVLSHVEFWTSPTVPFGLAKYRAYQKDFAPFDLRVYSHGAHFKSAVAMSLQTIRAITPNGIYTDAG